MAYKGPKGKSQVRKTRRKTGKDKRQDQRIRDLELFVKKTIENKQVNYSITATSMNSSGYATRNFVQLEKGPEDGANYGDPARIGNTITLMTQSFGFNFQGSATDTYNQIRVLLVESINGNQDIGLDDVLYYSNYGVFGDNVFSSPYTTKTDTNKRYKVHMDKCFTISGLGTKGGVPPTKTFRHNIRWPKGKLLEYSGPSKSLPTNHKINLLVITDSVSAQHPTMSYNVRSTYKDA